MAGDCWPASSICPARPAPRSEANCFASSRRNLPTAAGCGRWAASERASRSMDRSVAWFPPETASEWIAALLDLRELTHETASAILQLGRRVEDRTRDISPDVVRSAVAKLKAAEVADDAFLRPLQEYVAPVRADVCAHVWRAAAERSGTGEHRELLVAGHRADVEAAACGRLRK